MRNAERAINTVAILQHKLWNVSHVESAPVAPLTEPVLAAEALVARLRAAEHALPIDHLRTMLLAAGLPSADIFKQTTLAQEILLLDGFTAVLAPLSASVHHFSLAINETAEVRLLAAMAEIEGTLMIGVLLRFTEVKVVPIPQSFVRKNALFLGNDQGLPFHDFFESEQGTQLLRNWLGQLLELDLLLAAGALHEGEGDAERAPPVPQQLHDTCRVKHVAASETRASLSAKLLRVADRAELRLVDPLEEFVCVLGALAVQTG